MLISTHLESWPLISEAIEDATAAAQEVVHASVCVVQAGIKLYGVIYVDGGIRILLKYNIFLTTLYLTREIISLY